MPISHVSLACGETKFAAMRSFYLAALAPLGYIIFIEKENSCIGFKPANGMPDFWLHAGNGEQTSVPADADVEKRPGRTHVAFDAEDRDQVHEFFAAAIGAGGVSNGEPGLRPQYTANYYAAFVLDPLGNNIEVIHFKPN